MRKWNAPISAGIIVLFLIHAIAGAYQLVGVLPGGNTFLEVLAWIMAALIGAHVIIGIVLTLQTLRICHRSRAPYLKENAPFWIRRLSGLAMILFIVFHICIFYTADGGQVRLHYFGRLQLAASLLLSLCVAVHLLSNIKALMIGLGAGGIGKLIRDILFVLSVILVFCGAAFIIYYLRWNVWWRP